MLKLEIWDSFLFFSLNGNLKDIDTGSLFLDEGQGPTEDYENLRRRIYSNTKELWYYVNHELTKVLQEDNKAEKIQTILDQIAERKRFVFYFVFVVFFISSEGILGDYG